MKTTEIEKIANNFYPPKIVNAMSKGKGIYSADLKEAEREAFISGFMRGQQDTKPSPINTDKLRKEFKEHFAPVFPSEMDIFDWFIPYLASENKYRFNMPSDKRMIEIALLFNNGKIEHKKLADMVAYGQFILDSLYENGDVLKPSLKEETK